MLAACGYKRQAAGPCAVGTPDISATEKIFRNFVDDDIPLDLTAKLLCGYCDQDADWKDLARWQRRALTPMLEKEREERELQQIMGWFGKAVGFAVALLFDVFENRFSRGAASRSRKRRRR